MKTTRRLAVSFVLVFVIAACQKAASPVRPISPAVAPIAPAASSAEADQLGGPVDSSDNADKPDDPGMTTDRDKTVKQEQPSGDESSQAAPNEGDAEPPQ